MNSAASVLCLPKTLAFQRRKKQTMYPFGMTTKQLTSFLHLRSISLLNCYVARNAVHVYPFENFHEPCSLREHPIFAALVSPTKKNRAAVWATRSGHPFEIFHEPFDSLNYPFESFYEPFDSLNYPFEILKEPFTRSCYPFGILNNPFSC